MEFRGSGQFCDFVSGPSAVCSTPASERVADAAPTPKQGDTIQTGDSPTPEPQSDVDPTSLAVASPMPGEIDTAIQVNAVVAPQITLQPLDVRTITEPLWRVTRRTGDMNSVVTDGKGGLKVRLHSQIGTYPPIVETAVKEHEELHRTTMLRQTPAFLNVWSTERAGYAIGPNDTNPTGKRNFRLNEIECHNLEIGILQNWLNDGSRSHNAADDAKVTRRISLLQTSLGTHQRELNALPASP